MNYEAQAQIKGTEDWFKVTLKGLPIVFGELDLPQLQNMVAILQQMFPQNDYRIQEVPHE